jgi:hypothetical protein
MKHHYILGGSLSSSVLWISGPPAPDSGLRSGAPLIHSGSIQRTRDRSEPTRMGGGGATAEELPSGALWPVFLPTPAVRQGTPRTHIRNCGNQPAYQSLITDVYKSRLLPCAFTRSVTRKGGRENVCRPLEFGHQSARPWTCSEAAEDRRYFGLAGDSFVSDVANPRLIWIPGTQTYTTMMKRHGPSLAVGLFRPTLSHIDRAGVGLSTRWSCVGLSDFVPIPWQQRLKLMLFGPSGDHALEHVGKPRQRFNTVQLRSLHQSRNDCPVTPPAVTSSEKRVLSSNCY